MQWIVFFILSQFAYLPLEEVCTEAFDFSKGMPLGEAAAVMLALPDIKEKILTRRDLLLLRMLSESERFRNLRVCGCQSGIKQQSQNNLQHIAWN